MVDNDLCRDLVDVAVNVPFMYFVKLVEVVCRVAGVSFSDVLEAIAVELEKCGEAGD